MTSNRRHPFGALWQEFNQVQDEFAKWLGRAGGRVASPQLSVWEDEHAVYAEADLPGIDPAKLEVTVTEGNQLSIQGERTPPEVAGAGGRRQGRGQVRRRRAAADPAEARGRQAPQDHRQG